MSTLLRPFLDSADRWGVSRGLALAALIVPFAGLLVLPVLWLVSRPVLAIVAEEDGILEYAQFAMFVASAVVAAIIAARRWSAGHPWQAALFAVVAIGLVAVSGEEISWGQRILGFEAPEEIRELNEQGELTFHNLSGVLLFFNVGMLVASLYAIAAEPIGRRLRVDRWWADAETLLLPPLFLASAFAVMAVFRIVRLGALESRYLITRISEWAEFCFAAAILIFLLLALGRLRAGRAAAPRAAD